MRPRRPVAALVMLGLLTFGAASAAAGSATRAELVMGTIARVTLADPRSDVFEAAFAALRRVDATMSLYRPESALVRVNLHAARHAEPVDAELFECLARARALSALTDGAFDATVLPLLRRWGAYRELAHLPPGRVDAVGWGGLLLDAPTRTVRFARDGMAVDLGGIAKGYGLDRARAALLAMGARRGVIDLGGNLALLGEGPEGGWRIAVRDPEDPEGSVGTLVLDRDLAVSTSGNYARDFAAEGWRAPSHVYDPRTGRPVGGDLAVTVWAPDATTADALSTALLVVGPPGAAAVLARLSGVGALFVEDGRITFAGVPPRGFDPRPAASPPAVRPAIMESRQ
ncbi:MAG: FAD:protein FMN transferase [Deltaproteobacteria bacterium]|nr:FAD:protein FMN transferase [Deltaproteobacteria bacterium]